MADVISASARFKQSCRESHRVVRRAEIRRNGELVQTAEITGGSVTLDQTAASRGRCDVDLAIDSVAIPTSPTSAASPYGNELYLYRGIEWSDGTNELLPLGVFRMSVVAVNDTGADLRLRVTGLDRSARMIDARIEEAYQVAAGTAYGAAILSLLLATWPGMPYNASEFSGVANTTPALSFAEGDDRWSTAQAMAKSCGMNLWFDGTGTLRITPVASSGSAVEEIHEGDGGVLVHGDREWTREGAYNRVIATGENTSIDTPPARGVATDDNPSSPTYYYGPFGQVPRFYASPFITTDAQAQSAATAVLRQQLGATQTVSFGSLVLPYLEPRDVVSIRRIRAGIDELHEIDSLTIPMATEGTMTGRTRAVTV